MYSLLLTLVRIFRRTDWSVNYKTVLFSEPKFDFHSFILASSATEYTVKLACPENLLYSLVARKWGTNYDKLKSRGNLPTIAWFYQ